MTALFDLDSLLYRAVYKCVSISELREQISEKMTDNRKLSKANIRDWVTENAYNKLEQITFKILEDASELGLPTEEVELYISYCLLSERKKLDPSYKANRQRNIWVERLKRYIVEKSNMDVKYSLKWEADDLIANRAKKLRLEGIEYVVFAIDKDLRQIEGIHFNYDFKKVKNELHGTMTISDYKENWRDIQKEYFVEQGKDMVELYTFYWDYKGIEVVDNKTANEMLTYQLLIGDSGDNIKGVPRIGKVKADKLLKGKSIIGQLRAIVEEYKNHFGNNYRAELKKNYALIKIGQTN